MNKGNQPPPEESLPPADTQPPPTAEDLWPQLEAKINECTQLSQTLEEAMELNQRLETKCKSLEQLHDEDAVAIRGFEERVADLTSELDALQRSIAANAKAPLPPAQEPEPESATAADGESLRAECDRLQRELHEAKTTFKGVLRFLNDPANSINEKRNVLQRELAKP